MAKIEQLVPIIRRWEGGFSNHPNDKGGATMRGITISTYARYCAIKGRPDPTIEDLKAISDDTWLDILRQFYWNPMCADLIKSQAIANLCVDNVWGSGKGYIKVIQRELGVKDDGIVGTNTLAALNTYPAIDVFVKLWQRRKRFYQDLCKNSPNLQVFYKGWINRLNDFKWYE